MKRGRFRKKKKEDIKEVADDLNSIFGEEKEDVVTTEVFQLSEKEKNDILSSPTKPQKPKTKLGKVVNFFKKNVRPDIGIKPFEEGEGPDLENDDVNKISDKLIKNLKIGLKLTIRF